MVYKLVKRFQKEGVKAYTAKQVGRPRIEVNPQFVEKVVKIRNEDDYGSEKIHFVLKICPLSMADFKLYVALRLE